MNQKKTAFKAAFPHTLPVLAGYIFLGSAYGILMINKGFSIFWVIISSVFIYAGSLQFLSVSLLSAGFDPIGTLLVALMVNARHLFYGISMLGKFKGTGKFKPYLIFSLTDENFSILCSVEAPEGVDKDRFLFYISLLNHCYWICGSILGGLLGGLFTFNTKGLDFVLTALFVVIFIEQWQSSSNHIPALIGVFAALICRLILGPDNFLVAALILIIILLSIFKRPIERRNQHDK